MKIKVCGMKHNLAEVAQLEPDYLGFILYTKSPRDISKHEGLDINTHISEKTKRVGVFVKASVEFILDKIESHNLDVIQLHGDENPDFVKGLSHEISAVFDVTKRKIDIWKVFSIKDKFNFADLKPYETYVDAFLFDTKGKEKGGNGFTFDWSVLKDYPSSTPIILSGGIGLEHVEKLQQIQKTKLPIHAIDVNSKFEIKPGLKNIELLKQFIEKLKKENLMSH